jgi:hypothetical protein
VSLILAIVIGFVLGILLMVFLVTSRDEERLRERLDRAESSSGANIRAPDGMEEPVSQDSRGNPTGGA